MQACRHAVWYELGMVLIFTITTYIFMINLHIYQVRRSKPEPEPADRVYLIYKRTPEACGEEKIA